MKFSVQARQINYGYFEIEADSVDEAHTILADLFLSIENSKQQFLNTENLLIPNQPTEVFTLQKY